MNKKKFLIFTLLFPLLLTSCWIYPGYKEYKLIDNVYYFEDYETMKSVIIPLINKSFTAWHWSEEEFDKKYQKYFGNVETDDKDNTKLTSGNYQYMVRTSSTKGSVKPMEKNSEGQLKEISINGEYYWIIEKQHGSVIFYQYSK